MWGGGVWGSEARRPPAALCSLALPCRSLQRAEGALLLEPPPGGEEVLLCCSGESLPDKRGCPRDSCRVSGRGSLAWPLLSPRRKAPGVAMPFLRGPGTGSS